MDANTPREKLQAALISCMQLILKITNDPKTPKHIDIALNREYDKIHKILGDTPQAPEINWNQQAKKVENSLKVLGMIDAATGDSERKIRMLEAKVHAYDAFINDCVLLLGKLLPNPTPQNVIVLAEAVKKLKRRMEEIAKGVE